ncbi:MAG: hypothetical protein RJQ08_11310 [Salinisphaeraceae bacterium]
MSDSPSQDRTVQLNIPVPERLKDRFGEIAESLAAESGEDISRAEVFTRLLDGFTDRASFGESVSAEWQSVSARVGFHVAGLERLLREAYLSAGEGRLEAQQETEQARAAADQAQHRADELDAELKQAQADLKNADKQMQRALEQQQLEHQQALDSLERQMATATAKNELVEELRAQRDNHQKAHDAVLQQLTDMEERVEQLKAELDERGFKLEQERDRYHQASASLAEAQARAASATDRAQDARQELRTLTDKNSELREQLGSLKSDIRARDELIKELRKPSGRAGSKSAKSKQGGATS